MLENVAYKDDILSESDVFLNDVLEGLSSTPKSLPCKYFYDRRGSELFGKICETPEYYVTRTEIGLLREALPEIAQLLGRHCDILEFGSGAGEKIRLLLDALIEPSSYTPMDISQEVLLSSAAELRQQYPAINVRPWIGDYTQELAKNLNNLEHSTRKVVFFPGSTISNFTPEEAKAFLGRISSWLGVNGVLLIGVDTVKSETILHDAYNDAQGYTAEFNLNLLHRIRDELGVSLNVEDFYHQAHFNHEKSRIEMHLISKVTQSITVADRVVDFAKGESIHTENSYKYKLDDFRQLAKFSGFHVEKSWFDELQNFGFHYLISAG